MSLIETLLEAWGWCGIAPSEVVGENDFGNLMIKDDSGRYWRLCPEDLYCKVVAQNRGELDALQTNQEFLRDWYATGLVDYASSKLGVLAEGRKYCLKIPSVLGGAYGEDNIGTIALEELVRASGHIAREIKDLPDGSKVKIKVVD